VKCREEKKEFIKEKRALMRCETSINLIEVMEQEE
jgi:hypothetical protein